MQQKTLFLMYANVLIEIQVFTQIVNLNITFFEIFKQISYKQKQQIQWCGNQPTWTINFLLFERTNYIAFQITIYTIFYSTLRSQIFLVFELFFGAFIDQQKFVYITQIRSAEKNS